MLPYTNTEMFNQFTYGNEDTLVFRAPSEI